MVPKVGEYRLYWEVLFSLVLLYIKHCCLFIAQSFLYIYIKYEICKQILLIHTVKWPNSSISNNSLQHVSTLNDFKYCYVSVTIQLNISHLFTQLNDRKIIFQAIQFSLNRTLSGATTPGQSGPGSDGSDGVLRIPQSSGIIRASTLGCLLSYPRDSLVGGVLHFCRDATDFF